MLVMDCYRWLDDGTVEKFAGMPSKAAGEVEQLLQDGERRRVATTELEDGRIVSTCFLVLDHQIGFVAPNLPVLFETAILRGTADGATDRYSNAKDAVNGHVAEVLRLFNTEGVKAVQTRWGKITKSAGLDRDGWFVTLNGSQRRCDLGKIVDDLEPAQSPDPDRDLALLGSACEELLERS